VTVDVVDSRSARVVFDHEDAALRPELAHVNPAITRPQGQSLSATIADSRRAPAGWPRV